MHLIEAIVRNPVKVTVGVLLVALFGIIALLDMPKQLTPEVETPTLTIETRWPGASPQEVEREIVHEQEEQLKSVEGITKMTSESLDSTGRVILEFVVGMNMDEALLKVNSRLQQVREYPEDADEPVIQTSNSSSQPIAWFILSRIPPSKDAIAALQEQQPELRERLEPVRRTDNPGLALLRLRRLHAEVGDQFPELATLMPDGPDVLTLRRFAEDVIEAQFERVPGVANSNVIGGLEDELQVIVDAEELAARNLTIADVRRVLQVQNQDTSAGDFWEGKRRWVVRTLGQFRSPEDVKQQLLALHEGAPVYIRDVAEVRTGFKKPDGIVRRFGTSSIAVNTERETGANVLEVMDGLKETLADLNKNVLNPRGLQLTQVYDETEYIHSSIGLVQSNIFVGGALTMIVLMLFLHKGVRTLLVIPFIAVTAVLAVLVSPWFFAITVLLVLIAGATFARGALVVGLAIPTSIVGTFLMLSIMDRSLNVISLAGLAFAVGMLVDNAVVVLENIYRRYDMGEPPFTAAVRGTQEVWGAVVASTLTTIAVFLPVVFVQEEAGQLFRDIALAISSAVALSLVVSVTLIPMASARLLRRRAEDHEPGAAPAHPPRPATSADERAGNGRPPGNSRYLPRRLRSLTRASQSVLRPIDAFAGGFVGTIVAINRWVQRGTMRRISVIALLVGISAGLSWLFWPKVEYLPNGNRNLVIGLLIPPPGYNMNQLMELGETVEKGLQPYWDIDANDPRLDELDYPPIADFFFVVRGRSVFLGLRALDPLRSAELVELVREVGGQLPGTFAVAFQTSLFERGLSAGRTIDVEITGPELEHLVALGGRVMGQVKGGVISEAQVQPKPSLDLSTPELHVVPKLTQAKDLGMSAEDVGYTVNALVDGAYAGDYFLGGEKIDLTIIGKEGIAVRTQDIESLPVATPSGHLVNLGMLADVSLSSGPEQINHRERQRAITISVTPPPAMALEDAMERIRTQIVEPMYQGNDLDGGYRINLAGTADKLRQTWGALQFNVILALLITYLLMAALFESWLYPLVIILSVPLGAVGGILGLRVLNFWYLQPLDVLTMLGFVILIGTVVNNAILIVHQSLNHIREDGMLPSDAIIESVRTRIRPIFMTTTTTVLGLFPLVAFPGAGQELYRGLGSVVLGGLLVSTIFTLFLVPALFSVTMDIKGWIVRLFTRHESQEFRAAAEHPEPVGEPVAR
ncbi:MAG: efflux RND transporter permease subunit [Planctomycetaceae bacterium]